MNFLKVIYYEYFNDRRRNKFVDKQAQLQMAAEILLFIILFFFLLLLILFVDPLATLFSHYTLNDHQEAVLWLMEINYGKWWIGFILFGLMILASVFFSHRICGPAHKMITMLNMYARRDLRFPASVRQYDYLQKVPIAVNAFKETVTADIQALSNQMSLLEQAMEDVQGPARENLEQVHKQINEILKAYKFSETTQEMESDD